jgi:hypothetical protein
MQGRAGSPSTRPSAERYSNLMRQQIGVLLQLAALTLLPMLILWQLDFGIPLVVMPILTVVGIVLFYIGYKLREG